MLSSLTSITHVQDSIVDDYALYVGNKITYTYSQFGISADVYYINTTTIQIGTKITTVFTASSGLYIVQQSSSALDAIDETNDKVTTVSDDLDSLSDTVDSLTSDYYLAVKGWYQPNWSTYLAYSDDFKSSSVTMIIPVPTGHTLLEWSTGLYSASGTTCTIELRVFNAHAASSTLLTPDPSNPSLPLSVSVSGWQYQSGTLNHELTSTYPAVLFTVTETGGTNPLRVYGFRLKIRPPQ